MSSTRATVTGHEPYTARRNDSFDLLALQAYGEERMAHVIAEANPAYIDVLLFEGGEELSIPLVDIVETPDTLPPWRRS